MATVRQSVFSTLTSMGVLQREAPRALDLFAGTGVVGIEALSRMDDGARAVFVDASRVCAATIRANCDDLGFGERAQVVTTLAETALADPEKLFGVSASRPFDLVTLEPPYEEVDWEALLHSVASSKALGEDTIVVIEYPMEIGLFPKAMGDGRLLGLRNKKFGRTYVAFYICQPSGNLSLKVKAKEFSDKVL